MESDLPSEGVLSNRATSPSMAAITFCSSAESARASAMVPRASASTGVSVRSCSERLEMMASRSLATPPRMASRCATTWFVMLCVSRSAVISACCPKTYGYRDEYHSARSPSRRASSTARETSLSSSRSPPASARSASVSWLRSEAKSAKRTNDTMVWSGCRVIHASISMRRRASSSTFR